MPAVVRYPDTAATRTVAETAEEGWSARGGSGYSLRTDNAGDVLTYTLEDDAAISFDIATGQISVAKGSEVQPLDDVSNPMVGDYVTAGEQLHCHRHCHRP